MSPHRLTLVSPEQTARVADSTLFDWKANDLSLPGEWSIRQRMLRGGVSEGVHVLELAGGPLSVSVLPTRGMGIWKADCGGVPIGWNSPVQRPVHPNHVNLYSRNGLGWLEGFNELLCRCGLSWNGPPGVDEAAESPVESQLTLHGRIANTPAHTVEVGVDPEAQTLWVRGICEEACLFGPRLRLTSQLSLRAGTRVLTVRDEVQNLGAGDTELQLLYHINVGPPFLEEGSRFDCPFTATAPRDARAAEDIEHYQTYLGPTVGYAEQVYFFEPHGDEEGRCPALLQTSDGSRGLSVEFNPEQTPCFTLWKCTQAEADGYVTGLEPGTNFPSPKWLERQQGRVRQLRPGERFEAELSLEVHESSDSVSSVVERIAAIQTGIEPRIHSTPAPPFLPGE